MTDKKSYVQLMLESLQKKETVLDEILIMNGEQTQVLREETLDLDRFGLIMEKKDELITRLESLDNGFSALYNRMKEEFTHSKERYKNEILSMQQLIARITEKSVQIQAEEARNKLTVEGHFAKLRKEVKMARKSTQAATDYYKSMSKLNVNDAQFMDKKN